jgi:antitoxin VapB
VFIRKDPATGEVILSRRPDSWDRFFALVAEVHIPDDLLTDRRDRPPQKRELFA